MPPVASTQSDNDTSQHPEKVNVYRLHSRLEYHVPSFDEVKRQLSVIEYPLSAIYNVRYHQLSIVHYNLLFAS